MMPAACSRNNSERYIKSPQEMLRLFADLAGSHRQHR